MICLKQYQLSNDKQRQSDMLYERVFVCSRLAATQMTSQSKHEVMAEHYSRYVMREGWGYPFTPHLMYPRFLDDRDATDRAHGIQAGLSYLKLCDAICVFIDESFEISKGMAAEIAAGESLGLPIHYFDYIDSSKTVTPIEPGSPRYLRLMSKKSLTV